MAQDKPKRGPGNTHQVGPKKGEGKLYHLENNKISKQGVERRYQLNMVLVLTEPDKTLYQRYKITLNRSKIVNIELIYTSDAKKEE